MTFVLKNKKEIDNYLLRYGDRIDKALIYQLEYLVASLENHAKLNAGYIDQSTNLKSSIGGVILKNGKAISYKGFSSGTSDGISQGRSFIDSLINNFPEGYVVILVAGMEYATYVENYHNLNVLKKSELKMQDDLRIMLEKFKKKIESKI